MQNESVLSVEQVSEHLNYMVHSILHIQMNDLIFAFISTDNIQCIKKQIEKALGEHLGEEIDFILSSDTVQLMADIVQHHQRSALAQLSALNYLVVQKEFTTALASYNQGRRHEMWALYNNRMKIMPYPTAEKAIAKKGEKPAVTGQYQLSHPARHQHQQFLKEALRVHRPSAYRDSTSILREQ